jgi:hypothetical protein
MTTSSPQTKKHRSDKGLVLATPRDLTSLTITAHHYVMRQDHMREILSLMAGGPLKNPETKLLAMSTVDDIIDRWRRAGWVAFHRVLASEPAYLWVTKRGLQVVGLDELYKGQSPALTRYHHYHCVSEVFLRWWPQTDPEFRGQWLSERRLRAEALYVKHLPEYHATGRIRLLKGSIPDAVMVGEGWTDAIEVQLTPLKPVEMQLKLEKLLRAKYQDIMDGENYLYDDIHFYVPSDVMKRHIERACTHLDPDDRERVSISVDTDFQRFLP